MAEVKRTGKKNKATKTRQERRFVPDASQTSTPPVVAMLVGGLLLGAGLYAQWIRETPLPYAPYLLGVGALLLAAGLWFSDAGSVPVRVGDAGVALERAAELVRLPWCDMKRVELEKRTLVLTGEAQSLKIPVVGHSKAVASILSEGVRRVPDVMKAKRSDLSDLPEPDPNDGVLVPLEGLQIAGRACAASKKSIAFERDARLCPTCAQVYHKDHIPKTCVTCAEQLNGRTFSVS